MCFGAWMTMCKIYCTPYVVGIVGIYGDRQPHTQSHNNVQFKATKSLFTEFMALGMK